MERRELLKMIAVLTGGVMIGGNALLVGCSDSHKEGFVTFTKEELDFLNEVAETILPATKSPGAKAANVGHFMAMMVKDCYEKKDQQTFQEGMEKLNVACKKMYNKEFMEVTAAQRQTLLVALDQEAKDYQSKKGALEDMERKKDKNFKRLPNHYFTMMKQLTLLGFFTSEAGCKEALRYIAIPGKYEGSVPYKKGDKAWA